MSPVAYTLIEHTRHGAVPRFVSVDDADLADEQLERLLGPLELAENGWSPISETRFEIVSLEAGDTQGVDWVIETYTPEHDEEG